MKYIWLTIKIVVGLVVVFFVFTCSTVAVKLGEKSDSPPAAPRQPEKVAAPQPAALPSRAWSTRNEVDALTQKQSVIASLLSQNQLALQTPYEGRNFGRLSVRQSPRFGLDAYFEIERGQLVCGFTVDSCKASLSFDGAPPQSFGMVKPADNSSTTLFFAEPKRFIAAARKAKEIRLSATVFQAGDPTFSFATDAPLDWK
jgi:hypothetical protein